jgi:hypothetical protein
MLSEIIGGEFEIDISKKGRHNLHFKDATFYSSGRAALFNILAFIEKHIDIRYILLPDYLCDSILQVVNNFKFEIKFYSLEENLEINKLEFNKQYTESSIVFIINYFGCIDCSSQISFIKNIDSDACIIEDNVQAFYAMFNQSDADFSFTSFRKQLPVPDGAWVKSKYSNLPDTENCNSFAQYKIAGGILKYLRKIGSSDDQLYLELFDRGEAKIDENYRSRISDVSLNIIHGLNLGMISILRRRNAKYILEGLTRLNIKPIVNYSDDFVPLFVPIRLENRDVIRKALFNENIFCPIHWPVSSVRYLNRAEELAKNELSLVIDQRYTLADMEHILEVMRKTITYGD